MSPIQLTAKQQAYQRMRMCREIVGRQQSLTAIARKYGVSRKTAYKWLRRWEAGGRDVGALADSSRAPRHSPRRLSAATEAAIGGEARAHPHIGLVRLTRCLQRQGITVSVHGVYRALQRQGIYQQRQRRRGRKKYRRVEHHLPGEQVQADLLQLARGSYQLTLIDSATRWMSACMLPNKEVHTVVQALERLLQELPFSVQTLQTDHGTEFTYAFMPHVTREHPLDAWCRRQGITHRLIPVAYPRANGKVERLHRTCRQEFYRRFRLRPGQTWGAWLPKYVDFYNYRREHGSLHWLTPAQRLRLLQAQQDQGQTSQQTVTYV